MNSSNPHCICTWEDDGQDDDTADEVWGGPNGDFSLTQFRFEFNRFLNKKIWEARGRLITDPKKVLDICLNYKNNKNETIKKLIEKI